MTTKRIGRPPLPPAPQNAGDCRMLIAQETVKTKPRERTLRYLYKLMRAFVAAEDAARVEARTKALEEANQLKSAELELKRSEYRRRRELGIQRKSDLQQTTEARG